MYAMLDETKLEKELISKLEDRYSFLTIRRNIKIPTNRVAIYDMNKKKEAYLKVKTKLLQQK
jgi:hypothetical protein